MNCETLARQIQLANPKPRPNIVTSRIFVQSPSSVKDMGLPGFSTPISINSDLSNSNAVANCPEHLLKLEYYCDACKTSLCSDCAVLGNKVTFDIFSTKVISCVKHPIKYLILNKSEES